MNLDNYRKDFSIFIYNENLPLARLLKDGLTSKGYETHFYSSNSLFMQAIYLTLPHMVILPYFNGVQEVLSEVRKISKEILIILCAEDDNIENVMALIERGLAYDYVTNVVKNIKGFQHRVDQAAEKWLISITKEQAPQADPFGHIFKNPHMQFAEEKTAEGSRDSALSEMLRQKSEEEAINNALTQLQRLTGKEFAFLKNDHHNEILSLTDVSFGFANQHRGLGIRYAEVHRSENFWGELKKHPLCVEFFDQVFMAPNPTCYVLESGGQVLGVLAGLGELTEDSQSILESFGHALCILLDNFAKTRALYNLNTLDKRTDCLNNKTFYEKMSLEVSRARRLNLPVSVLSFQMSARNETQFNRAVLLVARVLKRFTRSTDYVGRISETRFAVLFPHTAQAPSAQKAGILLGIIKAALEEKRLMDVYVSAGVNEFPDQCEDSLSLLQGSEEACDQAEPFEVMVNSRSSSHELTSREVPL